MFSDQSSTTILFPCVSRPQCCHSPSWARWSLPRGHFLSFPWIFTFVITTWCRKHTFDLSRLRQLWEICQEVEILVTVSRGCCTVSGHTLCREYSVPCPLELHCALLHIGRPLLLFHLSHHLWPSEAYTSKQGSRGSHGTAVSCPNIATSAWSGQEPLSSSLLVLVTLVNQLPPSPGSHRVGPAAPQVRW